MDSALVITGKILLAYLLGSLSGSLILGRFRGVDVRKLGSGNAGGTNAFRTQGLGFAVGVVVIDVSKGAAAVWLAEAGVNPSAFTLQLSLWCGAAAVIGHIWPLFFGFKGGKGAATLIGILLMLWPWSLVPFLGIWLLSLLLSGYVGLATVLAGLSLIPSVFWWAAETVDVALLASGVIATSLIFTHRNNLLRMWTGQEYRFERARLLQRFLKS